MPVRPGSSFLFSSFFFSFFLFLFLDDLLPGILRSAPSSMLSDYRIGEEEAMHADVQGNIGIRFESLLQHCFGFAEALGGRREKG